MKKEEFGYGTKRLHVKVWERFKKRLFPYKQKSAKPSRRRFDRLFGTKYYPSGRKFAQILYRQKVRESNKLPF